MEIFVSGTGERKVTPNLIRLDFMFKVSEKTYEKATELGTGAVRDYLQYLLSVGFKKEDFKTSGMRVKKDNQYDEKTKKYVLIGYTYVHIAYVEFDYDLKRMADIIEKTSKLKMPPSCSVFFDIKDKEELMEEVVELAVKDAKRKAENVARAIGKKLKDCKRVEYDYEKASYNVKYCKSYEADDLMMSKSSAAQNIEQVFVPDDIVLTKSINCVFEA